MANNDDLLLRINSNVEDAVRDLNKVVGGLDKLDSTSKDAARSLDSIERSTERAGSGFTRLQAKLVTIGTSITAAYSSIHLIIQVLDRLNKYTFGAANETAAFTRELVNNSQALGISTQFYQHLAERISRLGLPLETARSGMISFTRILDLARDGNKQAIAAFDALSVSIDRTRSMEEVFTDSAKALVGFENSAHRTAIASRLFSESGARLIPVFKEIAESGSIVDQALEKQGKILSDQAIKDVLGYEEALNRWKDATATLDQQLGLFMGQNLAQYVDTAASALETLNINIKEHGDAWTVFIESAKDGFDSLVNKLLSERQAIADGFAAISQDALAAAAIVSGGQLPNQGLKEQLEIHRQIASVVNKRIEAQKDAPPVLPAQEISALEQLPITPEKRPEGNTASNARRKELAEARHVAEVRIRIAREQAEQLLQIEENAAQQRLAVGELSQSEYLALEREFIARRATLQTEHVEMMRELVSQSLDPIRYEEWSAEILRIDNERTLALQKNAASVALEQARLADEQKRLWIEVAELTGNTQGAALGRLALQYEDLVDRLRAAGMEEYIGSVTAAFRKMADETGKEFIDLGATIQTTISDAFEGIILGTRDFDDIMGGVKASLAKQFAGAFAGALQEKTKFDLKLEKNFLQDIPKIANLGAEKLGKPFVSVLSKIFGGGDASVTVDQSGIAQVVGGVSGGLDLSGIPGATPPFNPGSGTGLGGFGNIGGLANIAQGVGGIIFGSPLSPAAGTVGTIGSALAGPPVAGAGGGIQIAQAAGLGAEVVGGGGLFGGSGAGLLGGLFGGGGGAGAAGGAGAGALGLGAAAGPIGLAAIGAILVGSDIADRFGGGRHLEEFRLSPHLATTIDTGKLSTQQEFASRVLGGAGIAGFGAEMLLGINDPKKSRIVSGITSVGISEVLRSISGALGFGGFFGIGQEPTHGSKIGIALDELFRNEAPFLLRQPYFGISSRRRERGLEAEGMDVAPDPFFAQQRQRELGFIPGVDFSTNLNEHDTRLFRFGQSLAGGYVPTPDEQNQFATHLFRNFDPSVEELRYNEALGLAGILAPDDFFKVTDRLVNNLLVLGVNADVAREQLLGLAQAAEVDLGSSLNTLSKRSVEGNLGLAKMNAFAAGLVNLFSEDLPAAVDAGRLLEIATDVIEPVEADGTGGRGYIEQSKLSRLIQTGQALAGGLGIEGALGAAFSGGATSPTEVLRQGFVQDVGGLISQTISTSDAYQQIFREPVTMLTQASELFRSGDFETATKLTTDAAHAWEMAIADSDEFITHLQETAPELFEIIEETNRTAERAAARTGLQEGFLGGALSIGGGTREGSFGTFVQSINSIIAGASTEQLSGPTGALADHLLDMQEAIEDGNIGQAVGHLDNAAKAWESAMDASDRFMSSFQELAPNFNQLVDDMERAAFAASIAESALQGGTSGERPGGFRPNFYQGLRGGIIGQLQGNLTSSLLAPLTTDIDQALADIAGGADPEDAWAHLISRIDTAVVSTGELIDKLNDADFNIPGLAEAEAEAQKVADELERAELAASAINQAAGGASGDFSSISQSVKLSLAQNLGGAVTSGIVSALLEGDEVQGAMTKYFDTLGLFTKQVADTGIVQPFAPALMTMLWNDVEAAINGSLEALEKLELAGIDLEQLNFAKALIDEAEFEQNIENILSSALESASGLDVEDTMGAFLGSLENSIEAHVRRGLIEAIINTEALKGPLTEFLNYVTAVLEGGPISSVSLTAIEIAANNFKGAAQSALQGLEPVLSLLDDFDLGLGWAEAVEEITTGSDLIRSSLEAAFRPLLEDDTADRLAQNNRIQSLEEAIERARAFGDEIRAAELEMELATEEAALSASGAAGAGNAFMKSLKDGVKDQVLQGIIDAMVQSSALKPIIDQYSTALGEWVGEAMADGIITEEEQATGKLINRSFLNLIGGAMPVVMDMAGGLEGVFRGIDAAGMPVHTTPDALPGVSTQNGTMRMSTGMGGGSAQIINVNMDGANVFGPDVEQVAMELGEILNRQLQRNVAVSHSRYH